MFARRLQVEVLTGEERRACPLQWLDSFCMRRFTGNNSFDDTLPLSEGLLEAGFRVDRQQLAAEMGEWLTRKKGAGKKVTVEINEQ